MGSLNKLYQHFDLSDTDRKRTGDKKEGDKEEEECLSVCVRERERERETACVYE